MRITYLMRILNLKYLKNDLAQSQETFAKPFIGTLFGAGKINIDGQIVNKRIIIK